MWMGVSRRVGVGRWFGAFDEFAFAEGGASADEGDEVARSRLASGVGRIR